MRFNSELKWGITASTKEYLYNYNHQSDYALFDEFCNKIVIFIRP
jgi:hypothetical protein